MARPERPLDPAAGPVQRLAQELRELRRAAGSPSYRTMAARAGFSAATLSKAAAGARLPSLDVLRAYVRACGDDVGAWEPRWKEAEADAAQEVRPDAEEAVPPYRGLTRFEPENHDMFFGRDRLLAEVEALVCEHRFAAVFGPSGSGKSSLLRAGLIPRLRQRIQDLGHPAVLRVLTPGARPATTYGHLLAPAEGEPESWVMVDQFEEVFTLCRDREERDRFIDLLLTARDPGSRLRVLIAVRADFYARCAEHRGLADALGEAGLLVGPMTAGELREAVVRPAQAAGLLVERELTARIVEDVLNEPGGLPMFSHALLETWRRRRGRTLALSAYQAAGGVHGAIAATAEQVYEQLSPEQTRTARHLLLRMVEPGRGTPDTRRSLTLAELQEWARPDAPAVVDRLTRARLLTVDEDRVHLAHESLINGWPRLHGWIEEDRERLRHHRRLADTTAAWLEHDRDPGDLYRGTRLARALDLFARDDGLLTPTERAFLDAALKARETEAITAARSARRSRALLTALSAVVAVALAAGLTACAQHRDNVRRRTQATSRRVAEMADALRTTDPRTAQLLGVAAWRTAESPESRSALLGALAQPETDTFTDPAPGIAPTRLLAHSGRTLLSAGDGAWRTWDVATHRRLRTGRLPEGTVVGADPDGRTVLIARATGQRLWDTSARRWTGPALPADAEVDFGPDGRTYAVSGLDDDRVRLYSTTDGRQLFTTRAAGRAGAAPSTDGRLLATCPVGGAPRLWDTAHHKVVPGAWQAAGAVCDDDYTLLAFAGPGTGAERFAVSSATGVRVWDAGTGRMLADVPDRGVRSLAFSADGTFLAAADTHLSWVWRIAPDMDGHATLVLRHCLNNQSLYDGLAWDPEKPLLRYLEGGTVHTLDLTDAVTPAWRNAPYAGVLLSPDGRTLATAERTTDAGYRFQLRDTRDGRLLRTLSSVPAPVSHNPGHPLAPQDAVALLAFSPDGGTLAYGVSDPGLPAATQRITLWDVAEGRATTTLDLGTPSSGGSVSKVLLGPGGRTLYAVRTSGTGGLTDEVWDTAGHRRTAAYPNTTGTTVAVRPDGRLLVGTDRAVRLPVGRAHAADLTQGEEVAALAFSADSSRLAAGDRTGRVTLWDGALKHRAGVLHNTFPAPVSNTTEALSALAVSPDGHTLAVGGDAGTLQLWDIATQQPLGGPLLTSGDAIDSLAFSSDSTALLAAGPHTPLRRYTIDPARAAAQVCARLGDTGPTLTQWHTYLPDTPYRKACDR